KMFSDNEGRIAHDLICRVRETQIQHILKDDVAAAPAVAAPVENSMNTLPTVSTLTETKPEVKPEVKAEDRPEVKAEVKPIVKSLVKVETNPAIAEIELPPVDLIAQPTDAAHSPKREVAGVVNDLVGKYTIQFSLNASQDNAKRAVENLIKSKVPAEYWEVTIKGKHLYIVGAGVFPSLAEAQKVRNAFPAEIGQKAVIHKFK
ncbi:MAG: SPOR domain-containing protein, partial [Bdellovibrionia bacterium]